MFWNWSWFCTLLVLTNSLCVYNLIVILVYLDSNAISMYLVNHFALVVHIWVGVMVLKDKIDHAMGQSHDNERKTSDYTLLYTLLYVLQIIHFQALAKKGTFNLLTNLFTQKAPDRTIPKVNTVGIESILFIHPFLLLTVFLHRGPQGDWGLCQLLQPKAGYTLDGTPVSRRAHIHKSNHSHSHLWAI